MTRLPGFTAELIQSSSISPYDRTPRMADLQSDFLEPQKGAWCLAAFIVGNYVASSALLAGRPDALAVAIGVGKVCVADLLL